MHSSCLMCDCWSFWAPCGRKQGAEQGHCADSRVVNTWEEFYLLSDVVDPGWRAVAKIRSLRFPDTIRRQTPESCNTCNRKVAVFSVTGCIFTLAPHVKGFWELICAQVLSRTLLSHLSVLVSHQLGPLRALRHKRPVMLCRNVISNLANSNYRQRTCRNAARYWEIRSRSQTLSQHLECSAPPLVIWDQALCLIFLAALWRFYGSESSLQHLGGNTQKFEHYNAKI